MSQGNVTPDFGQLIPAADENTWFDNEQKHRKKLQDMIIYIECKFIGINQYGACADSQ